MNKKLKYVLRFIVCAFIIVIPTIITAIYDSVKYNANDFKIQNGVLDFKNKEIDNYSNGIRFDGEMELYYNKWIVTDNTDYLAPDAYINMPDFWTSVKVNGQSLSKNGYATYRFTIINLPINYTLSIDSDYFYSSFRVYFDDTLMGECGTLGKTRDEDVTGIRFVPKTTYKTTSSTLTVSIEVGNSGQAGLVKAPKIKAGSSSYLNNRGKELIAFILLGILIETMIIFIVVFGIIRGWKRALLATLAPISLISYWLFSGDGLDMIKLINISNVPYPLYRSLSLVAMGIFILVFFALFTIASRNARKNVLMIGFSVIDFACIIVSLVLQQSKLFIIPISILFSATLLGSMQLLKASKENRLYKFCFIVFYCLISAFLLSAFDDINYFHMLLSNVLSYYLLILDLLLYFGFLFNLFAFRIAEKERTELIQQQGKIKALALREHVNPDQIFNALSIIQDFYHKSTYLGDLALKYFSDDLRYGINTMEYALVPFEDELSGLTKFTDFENMRSDRQIEIVYNIEDYEFMVPPILLKTIVEQAYFHPIKDVQPDNNYLEISASSENGFYTIEIIDHRGGYDVGKDTKVMQNLAQRIKLSLNGTIVFSYDNRRTITKITFFKSEKPKLINYRKGEQKL